MRWTLETKWKELEMFVKWISQCSFNQKRLVCNKRMFYLSRRRRIIQIYLRRQDNNSKKKVSHSHDNIFFTEFFEYPSCARTNSFFRFLHIIRAIFHKSITFYLQQITYNKTCSLWQHGRHVSAGISFLILFRIRSRSRPGNKI